MKEQARPVANPETKTGNQPENYYDTIIVGAGFSGIGMAIALKQAGRHNFLIIDSAGEIGGTWRDNQYPGAGCDVPSHLYSFSFEQNPRWSRMFARSAEIQEYLLRIVDKYHLRSRCQLNTKIETARFDEVNRIWQLETKAGTTFQARTVIVACGILAEPAWPDIPGRDKFEGSQIHTARWDHNLSLEGKTVAVIGSGASAIQLVPAIAPRSGQVNVFQRTASWIVPKLDYEIGPTEQQLYESFPPLQWLRRYIIFALTELLATGIVYDGPMTNLLQKLATWNMTRAISDPDLIKKCTPDYRLGCKRMLISNDWYPALARPNVELIPRAVREITKDGVIAANGQFYPADVLVYATGFHPPSAGAPFQILGNSSRRINEDWADGSEAFKGMTVSGYPNLFFLAGPNTGPGHTSVLVYVEAQISYIRQALQKMDEAGWQSLEVRPERQKEFNDFIAERMEKTTWTSGCDSWYLAPNGRNTTLYPGFASEYVLSVREFSPADYIVRS